ncbi:PucR family transcriptional regulator ligand-binding domain-containing protein [Prauserella halophila]|uniref:PucR family transcriptional regulator ligand-binding domain-containing protein n=1 Tax=Prauserella halophila TaxID=185641 RepID=A0ABN1W805_9PSEU|nr:PucR family transcriptional regulator [Prauserella halophila]MCP2236273.1 PucR C-terminal helix-turn-helix domain-containing protein [Prauserella halophila]
MLLRTLLDDPDLRLELLTGAAGLDRVVRWVYTTDLRDPRRYLSGGEVVLTGLMWHESASDSETFVAGLVDAGVAGLISGTARLGAAPPDLIEACGRHDLPLIEVPLDVSFAEISDRVVLGVTAERTGMFERSRRLVADVAEGADLGDVLRSAAAELGIGCWVLSTTGRSIAAASPAGQDADDLPEPARRAAVRRFVRTERLPASFTSGDRVTTYSVTAAGPDTGSRAAQWFVVLGADHRGFSAGQEAVVGELGTAVALLRARLDEGRRVARQGTDMFLRTVLDTSAPPAEIASRLGTLGHDPAVPVRVLACQAGEDAGLTAALLAEIGDELAPTALIGSADADTVAVLATGSAAQEKIRDVLRAKLAALEPALGQRRLTLGVSGAAPVDRLRSTIEEARHARLLAEHRLARESGSGSGVRVVAGDEVSSHALLLAALPDELSSSFHERLLRDLRAYDARHQSDLVHTLWLFLEASGSWAKAAAELHVHVNTLRYRIRRIEEITGKDLARFADRVDLYLALQLG